MLSFENNNKLSDHFVYATLFRKLPVDITSHLRRISSALIILQPGQIQKLLSTGPPVIFYPPRFRIPFILV